MPTITIQIFASDLPAVLAHYTRAFGATKLAEAYGDDGEPIHLEMDVMGNRIAVAPHSEEELAPMKCGVTTLCMRFEDETQMLRAYYALKEDGTAEELREYPWSRAEAYVTDKFGVRWCIGI